MRVTVVLVLALTASAAAQNVKPSAELVAPIASGATSASTPAPAQLAEYIIGPEDVLQVTVWKEADFSGSVPVRPDGRISLPLLNDVQAAGLTPVQLSAYITGQLKQFINEPRVTVTVTGMNSHRAYVMGQVTRQGAVLLVSNLTVLQALSAAGGPAPYAKTSKIYVLRMVGGKQTRIPFNYGAAIRGKSPEQSFVLMPGDTIVVP